MRFQKIEIGDLMKKLLALLTAFVIVFSPIVSAPSYAACTSSQAQTVERAEYKLMKAQSDLSKVDIKINKLQQNLNGIKPGHSYKKTYERQLTSALRDQGKALKSVSNAQKDLERAKRCR